MHSIFHHLSKQNNYDKGQPISYPIPFLFLFSLSQTANEIIESLNNWRKIERFSSVPNKTYVADVFTSHHDRNVVYAVLNNHKEGDFKPYMIRSNDLGKTWQLITNGIAEPHACWSIYEDHISPDLLFAATEYGIFCSINGGNNWTQMKNGLPTIAFRDLEIQKRGNDLVGASFGRGMYILDDYSLLRNLSQKENTDTTLFP